jgi:dihydrodipicolinate synthase/N-acetylneuraminate lyase
VRERRRIRGASAVLMPLSPDGEPDWPQFEAHLSRTVDAGLVPALNMDTGFGPVLTRAQRDEVLRIGRTVTDELIAGVHVDDRPGDDVDEPTVLAAVESVAATGALPIVFPFHGMARLDDAAVVELHARIGSVVDRYLAFELGPMFHPAGRILSAEAFSALLQIPAVVGLKHSSLRRDLEWDRIGRRDRQRPDFALMTGNDLAIDLVVHGSDYLLGLSTFAPDAFAARDRAWERGDAAVFWELNDLLQYLGQFAFRPPVPGYRHDAAMFLELRGQLRGATTHPGSPRRPDADRAVLADIAERLEEVLSRAGP